MTLEELQTENLVVGGNPDADIIVVCDTPSQKVFDEGRVMSKPAMQRFAEEAKAAGLVSSDFFFVTCSSPVSEQDAATEGRLNKFLDPFRPELMGILKLLQKGKLLIYLGKTAARVCEGKPCRITQLRGKLREIPDIRWPVLPLLSPKNVLNRPEVEGLFRADFQQLRGLKVANFSPEEFGKAAHTDRYEWVTDLQFLLDNPPKILALDTETDGLNWADGAKPLLATLCWEDNYAIAVPLDIRYWPELGEKGIERVQGQLRTLLANPKVAVTGHNTKFDLHILKNIGIEVANWYADSLQMAFATDENMVSKTLADCVRRWVPQQAGYSDIADSTWDKSRMLDIKREDMLPYSCGDSLACYRLIKVLNKILRQDMRQFNAYHLVQMPALRMFVDMEEAGIKLDTEALVKLEKSLGELERESYRSLIAKVPAAVKRKHLAKLEKGEELSFGIYEFTRDILFSKEGFNLTPVVFTKGTSKLGKAERVPSVSSKQHLPFFADNPFVAELIAYQKLQKMRSTYVGQKSRTEVARVALTAKGKLPNPLVKALAESGVTYDLGELSRGGQRIRPRKRLLELGDQTFNYKYRLPLKAGKNLLVREDDSLWLETQTEASGFWPCIRQDGRIHPSIILHSTVTGRTATYDPSSQNWPQRGHLAKEFRKIFIPKDGCVFLNADLSQAELRIAAWMANEKTMLGIYGRGGDIHEATAARTMGVKLAEFQSFRGKETACPNQLQGSGFTGETLGEYYDFRRYQAKAINFGFIYSMGWPKFKTYAKTDYGLDLTDAQAQQMRESFFDLYPGLAVWHKDMRNFVRKHGYVRALHGALRRLPQVWSDDEKIARDCEAQAINSNVQRFASDIGLMGATGFMEGCPKEDIRILAFIHDSVIIEVREDRVEEAAAGIKWFMENPPLEELFGIKAPLPIVSDVKMGKNLSKMEDMKIEAKIPSWSSV